MNAIYKNVISKLSLLLLAFASYAKSSELNLGDGIWEGIFKPHSEFNILSIKEDEQYAFIRIALGGELPMKRYLFSKDQIKCSKVNCIIEIKQGERRLQLSINRKSSKDDDALVVMETPFNKDGNPIASYTYELKKSKKGKTAFKSFVERFSKKFEGLTKSNGSELEGLWIGTIETDSNTDLFIFHGQDKGKYHFIRYVLGLGGAIEYTFLSSDIVSTGEELKIDIVGKLFPVKVIIHKKYSSQLSGYLYSYHKGNLIQQGTFSAGRLSPRN